MPWCTAEGFLGWPGQRLVVRAPKAQEAKPGTTDCSRASGEVAADKTVCPAPAAGRRLCRGGRVYPGFHFAAPGALRPHPFQGFRTGENVRCLAPGQTPPGSGGTVRLVWPCLGPWNGRRWRACPPASLVHSAGVARSNWFGRVLGPGTGAAAGLSTGVVGARRRVGAVSGC